MYILGLSGYAHESSACLIKDGKIIALIEEERLNREKHTWKFPQKAIEECLRIGQIRIGDVDHFTFFWVPVKEIVDNIQHFIRFFPQSLNLLTTPSGGGDLSFLKRVSLMQGIGQNIQKQFGLSQAPPIHFIEHHLAHAASAFFISPFEEAAILTMDGRGESTSTMLSVGRKSKIEKIEEIKVPHSLGHLYAAVTDYLGFKPFFDEWKVMGMSAYGKEDLVKDFEELVHLSDDGRYQLNLKYFSFHTHGQNVWVSDAFIKKFGSKRPKNQEYTQHHFNVALALQRTVERAGVHLAKYLQKRTGLDQLCMTGGVVLNCLMNKRIVEETLFKEFFFMPIANDAGTSMGSALYFYHQVLGHPRSVVFENIYLGPQFLNQDIEKVLKQNGVTYRKSADIARDTAAYIAQGKIIGWFQGAMEAGPRALGNRSIVVNPMDPTMKDRLNARVKKREHFRPFAPSILEEKVHEYFSMPKDQLSPYMILIGDVLDHQKSKLPAITHADGTARVHTVSQRINPRYWQLIHEFEKLSGVPVLLNTSFNENEPVVCTPEHAVNCFLRTEFDVLAIGDYLVVKS